VATIQRFAFALGLASGLLTGPGARAQTIPPYKNAGLPLEDRVKDLIARMTMEEKFWQLFAVPDDTGAIPVGIGHGVYGLQVRGAAEEVVRREVAVTDQEIEAAYAAHAKEMVRDGKKIPLMMVKEQIRMSLQNEKRRKAFDDYVAELKGKGKVTVNDGVLPKV